MLVIREVTLQDAAQRSLIPPHDVGPGIRDEWSRQRGMCRIPLPCRSLNNDDEETPYGRPLVSCWQQQTKVYALIKCHIRYILSS